MKLLKISPFNLLNLSFRRRQLSTALEDFSKIENESLFSTMKNHKDHIHFKRWGPKEGPPVLMVHGAIENGRIFYSQKGKGLAPFLASKGYNVFVADFRGHGESYPKISEKISYSQTDAIVEDIPHFLDFVSQHSKLPCYVVCHSWGGIILNSYLSRFPNAIPSIKAIVCFGSKRNVTATNLHALFFAKIIWNRVSFLITKAFGYMPGRLLRFGSDDDTKEWHADSVKWVTAYADWIDTNDNFDYGKACTKVTLPPTLYFAAEKDYALGHKIDVQKFMKESHPNESLSNNERYKYVLLSKKNNFKHDYDHINMLTHKDAQIDQFPLVLKWLEKWK